MNAQLAGLAPTAPFPQMRRTEGRVDIHFHLLPGIDDGPVTLDESVDLAVHAALEGTRTIVATPHVRSDFVTDVAQLPGLVREVRSRLAREGVDITVLCGAELGHDMVGRLSQDDLELIAQGPPGSRWLLVETPFEGITAEFAAATTELRAGGFACVLAHPERGAGVLDDDSRALRTELERGGLLQINGSSLAGWHGDGARDVGFELAATLSAVVASDAHGATRPPALSVAHDLALVRGLGAVVARDLVEVGPRSLLRGGISLPLPVAA